MAGSLTTTGRRQGATPSSSQGTHDTIAIQMEESHPTPQSQPSADSLWQNDRPARRSKWTAYLGPGGRFRPFRLLAEDASNIKKRYISDWTLFNQQIMASAIYIFFTNILPGMTFANDLFIQTGKSWGTIEIIFSTGLCGLIFSV
jgi:hypothetical protein